MLYTWLALSGNSQQDIGGLQTLQGAACCMRTRRRNSHRSASDCDRDDHSVPVRAILANVIIALSFPSLILSLPCHSQSDTDSSSSPNQLAMVVHYACMACQGATTYFTTYEGAAVHYDRPEACL